jgi:SdrD B-like domain
MIIQSRLRTLAYLLAVSALTFAGCDSASDDTTLEAPAAASLAGDASITLNQYVVLYEGRTYDAGSDKTTFSYRVTGTGVAPALSHFSIELPECAPALASYTPPKGAKTGVDPITGIFGIKWHAIVGINASSAYSVTFPGNVVEGTIRVSVQAGPESQRSVEAGALPGSCKDAERYTISGVVFEDTDTDSVKDDIEAPLADVTVLLAFPAGDTLSTSTDAAGAYHFEELPAGDYTVRIPSSTNEDDFNETLFAYYVHTGTNTEDPSQSITLGPDADGVNFGFAPIPTDIVEEIISGELVTTGETVKYWKDQLEGAINGVPDEIDAATLLGYLDVIETIYRPEWYQFGTEDRLEVALDYLKHKPDDGDWYELREELLATQLNTVRGLGVTGAAGLQNALIAWGESLLIANDPTVGTSAATAAPATLTEAAGVFNAINGGGGKTNE